MNGPRLICFGCSKDTTMLKPVCDDCLGLGGEVRRSICMLCEAGLLVDALGMHQSRDGGHAGRCTAVAT